MNKLKKDIETLINLQPTPKRRVGAPSQIVQGRGRGGKIFLRLGKERHLAFARWCEFNKTSMNETLINMIDKLLDEGYPNKTGGKQ